LGRGGQRGEVGEAGHEALEVRLDGGHHRLLQHQLRDQRPVRAGRAAPRQVALVAVEPGQQARRDARERAAARAHRNATATAASTRPNEMRNFGRSPSPSQSAANTMKTISVIASCRIFSWYADSTR